MDLLKNIDESKLSSVTKTNYRRVSERLQQVVEKDLEWILRHPDETMRALKKAGLLSEATSKRQYISIILGIFKYNPSLNSDPEMARHRKTYMTKFNETDAVVREKYNSMRPSKKQTVGFVPWTDVTRIRDGLDRKSVEYFVLCCYSMIPPVRADLGDVKIVRDSGENDDLDAKNLNYLMISGRNKITLCLNSFKTDKHYDRYCQDLPANLRKVIFDSLRRDPREYLIVSPSTKKPFVNPESFSKFVSRILQKVFGKKHASINMLRHSFISNLDLNEMSASELREVAQKLMHTVSTLMTYRLRVPQEVPH